MTQTLKPEPVTIYVALLDEEIEVWRPVQAIRLGDSFTIISKNDHSDLEQWQFAEGETVYCKPHGFSDGEAGLVAYAKADNVPELTA
jgi:hypothetical protein